MPKAAGAGHAEGLQVARALRVAQDLCNEAASSSTPSEAAAAHLTAMAIVCQECVSGEHPSWPSVTDNVVTHHVLR